MKIWITFFLALSCLTHAETTEADALAFLKKNAPEIHAKITQLPADDYQNALADAIKTAEEHVKIEASGDSVAAAAHLKMYRIDFESIALSDEILRAADESEKQLLTTNLRKLISDSFDQWIIVEQARVQRLEKQLAALKGDLEKAQSDREKVIDADVQTLLEESKAYQATKDK